jgi:hypothetical protein
MLRTLLFLLLCCTLSCQSLKKQQASPDQTEVRIQGEAIHINGKPTYEGRYWEGYKIEGLLFNSRMVQGVFDDLNPETRPQFHYPDTDKWDPERNTNEFVAAMSSWRDHGVLGFTINLQGGSPIGYGNRNWRNSAFDEEGALRPDYMNRLKRILDRADELGMVPIVGFFYFGQDEYLADEAAVFNATDNATQWLLKQGYRNVLIEINNECNIKYDHAILQPEQVHRLIERVQKQSHKGHRLLVSTSYSGGTIPNPNVVKASDFILIHSNGVSDPNRIAEMVEQTRAVDGYRTMPVIFNEDDHYNYNADQYNLRAAVASYASWGYFDFRRKGEDYKEGFQSVPVDWSISSDRKRAFFEKVREITGY